VVYLLNDTTLIIRNRSQKEKTIKDAIFALSGGAKSLLIKGEGEEISTAVEVAEILKSRMYPSIEIANVSLGSRPFFEKRQQNRNRRNFKQNSRNNKDLISKIEITLSKPT
jgi:DNA-binding protein Alba